MADGVQLNLPTSTGAVIHTDEVVINTVTGHVQRMKVGFGTDGVWNDTSTNDPLPVQFVSAQEVSLATTQGIFLKTSTGGAIPADTTSGLAVKFVNAQSVAVTEITPGTSASNIGKAEDSAHNSGDVGVMPLAVRADNLAALAGADGDYAPLQVNDKGALWVHEEANEVDSTNSSTTILLANNAFTGTSVELLHHDGLAVQIDASHDSATDGMQFQFSNDGTNWDIEHLFTYTAANGGRIFQFGAHSRYFRFIYTNGGTDQTHFRCQTILSHGSLLTTIHRLVDAVDPDRSATLVKSIILGQAAGSGNFVPVQTTAAGNFKVAVEEFDTSLPIGTNHIGSVALETSTGGAIPADTTSGIMVKFGSAQDVSIATGQGFALKTPTGGNVPADTTSGLAVKFVNAQDVNLASGQSFFIQTSTGGAVPADTTSGLTVKFANGQPVDSTLQAGTATIGTVNIQTATTVNTQVQAGTATVGTVALQAAAAVALNAGTATVGTVFIGAGTATMGTVNIQTATTLNTQLQAGTATIGTVNLPTTATLILNTAPSLATGDRGPKTTNVTASGTTALVTAAGANTSIYVTGILCTNTATTVHRGALSDGTNRFKHNLAANGGGFCWASLNPPWKLPGNTALNWITTDTVDIDATIHFYTGAT